MRLLPAIVPLLLVSCSGGGDTATVPRRTAYPRPQLPDTAMIASRQAPMHFLVNAEARDTAPRPGWLDVAYPTLGASVHVSFTATDPLNIKAVKENRMERLMLNLGDAHAANSEFVNPAGYDILLSEAEGSLTPLQFLATDDSAWVVSGAVYFADPQAAEAVDSMRPIISALRRDLLKSLENLREK